MQKNNIILIGFMGVGKGTVARAYSQQYKLFNIDTDDLIESKENKKIKKIFEEEGEKAFRQQEQFCANWIEHSVDNSLISCGGGFYKVNNLKKLGRVVLLDASFEWIYERLLSAENSKAKLKKRPLFSQPLHAQALYNEREEIYKAIADIVISVESKSIDEIVLEIHEALKFSQKS